MEPSRGWHVGNRKEGGDDTWVGTVVGATEHARLHKDNNKCGVGTSCCMLWEVMLSNPINPKWHFETPSLWDILIKVALSQTYFHFCMTGMAERVV